MTTALGTRDGGEIAVAFSRVLRGAGIDVPTSSTIAFGEALAATGLNDRRTTYWAGRATLVRRPEDHELYDRAFRVFWDHASATVELQLDEPLHVTLAIDDDADDDRTDPDRGRGVGRPGDRAAIQRHRSAAPEGLRRLHPGGVDRGATADEQPATGRLATPFAAVDRRRPAHRPSGSATHDPRRDARWR